MVDFLWDWFAQNGFALFNVIMIDVVLAGDNAITVSYTHLTLPTIYSV